MPKPQIDSEPMPPFPRQKLEKPGLEGAELLRTTRRPSRLWLHYRRGARSDGRGNRARLYFKGTVATEAQKNELWNAIKTIPTWQKDIVADIQVTGEAKTTAAAPAGAPKIFELNRDQLTDPDKIRPGQVLRLP